MAERILVFFFLVLMAILSSIRSFNKIAIRGPNKTLSKFALLSKLTPIQLGIGEIEKSS
jgi:hypothetical protein